MLSLPSTNIELSGNDVSAIWKELKEGDPSDRYGNCGYWATKLSQKLIREGIPTKLIRVSVGFDRSEYHMVAGHKVKGKTKIFDPTVYAYANSPGGILYETVKNASRSVEKLSRLAVASSEMLQIVDCYELLNRAETDQINDLDLPGYQFTQLVDFDREFHIV